MNEMVMETSMLGALAPMLDCAKVSIERIGRELYIAPENMETKKESIDDIMEDIWKTFKSDGHAVDRFLERKHREKEEFEF